MNAFFLAAVSLALGADPVRDVIDQDFRAAQLPADLFARFGSGAKLYVHEEQDGLRITLPGQEKKIGSVGIACKHSIAGDFEATLTYEILKVEGPRGGYGMGLSFSVVADNAVSDTATVGHRFLPKGGFFGTDRAHYSDGKYQGNQKRFLTASRHGKLRLSRRAAEVRYAVLGEEDTDFRELRREPFVDAPLKAVRITADTGAGFGDFDVRLTHLNIRLGEPADAPVPKEVRQEVPAEHSEAGPAIASWIWIAVILGAAAVVFVVVWLTMRLQKTE